MLSEPLDVDNLSKKYDCVEMTVVAIATIGRLIDSPAVCIYPGAPQKPHQTEERHRREKERVELHTHVVF